MRRHGLRGPLCDRIRELYAISVWFTYKFSLEIGHTSRAISRPLNFCIKSECLDNEYLCVILLANPLEV